MIKPKICRLEPTSLWAGYAPDSKLTKVTFTWHQMNFQLAEKFDWTLPSYGTVQYLHSFHLELLTTRQLNFGTVKVVLCEQNT